MTSRRKSSVAIVAVVLAIFAGLALWAVSRSGGERASGGGAESRSDQPGTTDAVETGDRAAAAGGDAGTPAQMATPPDTVAPPRASEPTRVVVRAEWGGGSGQLGRDRPQEANPEAPMSLTTAADGTVLVLDQVNGRITRFGPDGRPLDPIRLGVDTPQDLALGGDGTIAVLDRLVSRRVAILSPDGREVGSLPLEGEGVPETGGVTGVFVDGEDVYVERENGPLVRIGDVEGAEGDRAEVPGRPTRDGLSWIMAGLVEPLAGRFFVNSIARPSREHRYTRDIAVPMSLRQILLLDTDRSGIIYVAVAGTPYGASEEVEEVRLLCLAPADGTTIGFAVLPPNLDPDETLREMTVLDGGGVLYAMRSDEGVTIGLFDCRG